MQRTYYTIGKKTCCDNGIPWLQSETKPAKIFNLIFIILIFTLQNVNAKDTVFFNSSSEYRSFALWQGQIKLDSNKEEKHSGKYYMQTDSILFGDLYQEIGYASFMYRTCSLKLNTDYIFLLKVLKLGTVKHFDGNCEDILPKTQKNRQKLIKKYKETIVVYKYIGLDKTVRWYDYLSDILDSCTIKPERCEKIDTDTLIDSKKTTK